MITYIIGILLTLTFIALVLYRPEIDKLENGTIILWLTPIGDRNMRDYVILKQTDVH